MTHPEPKPGQKETDQRALLTLALDQGLPGAISLEWLIDRQSPPGSTAPWA